MGTEYVTESTFHPRNTTASGALVADLAADSTDLLDLSAALGVEFRHVVTELLRAPHEPAPRAVRALASITPHPRTATPRPSDAPPFVWVRLLDGRRPSLTVRAGWLEASAVRLIAAEARASGPQTEVHVIVPYDSGDDAVGKVQALCRAFAPDVKLTIDVQGEKRTSRRPSAKRTGWWGSSDRASKVSRSGEPGYRGTWVVLGPVAVTP